MRSQGRTEQRALLALDGVEDMQGGYVQLTRSTDRTDMYLTVGPEPLGPDEERPHPARQARAPEELLERVLTRDGSKTLASDTPNAPEVRRLSTAELRAERDRLAQLRAECPPDRSRELHLAAQRAAEAEQARQQARTDHQAASEQVAALAGSWLRRRELAAARDRLVLAEHALRTTTGQADQAAERLGLLRRGQQRRLGWMEAHDQELRVRERAVLREDAWRRRVDQRALVLDPPGWLVAELGPVPSDPRERAVWRGGAAAVTSARSIQATASGTGPTRAGCWATNPAATALATAATGTPPGPRWSTWPAGAATATTATPAVPTANDPSVTSVARNATAASWQKGVAHAPAPRPRRPRRGPRPPRGGGGGGGGGGGPGGAGHAGLPGHWPVGPGPDRRGAPAVPGGPPRPARRAAGQRLDRPGPT